MANAEYRSQYGNKQINVIINVTYKINNLGDVKSE